MDVTPLKRYREPGYPTHAVLETQPEVLRFTPRRWQRNAIMLTAVAGSCLFLSGCDLFTKARGHIVTPQCYRMEDEVMLSIVHEATRAERAVQSSQPIAYQRHGEEDRYAVTHAVLLASQGHTPSLIADLHQAIVKPGDEEQLHDDRDQYRQQIRDFVHYLRGQGVI